VNKHDTNLFDLCAAVIRHAVADYQAGYRGPTEPETEVIPDAGIFLAEAGLMDQLHKVVKPDKRKAHGNGARTVARQRSTYTGYVGGKQAA